MVRRHRRDQDRADLGSRRVALYVALSIGYAYKGRVNGRSAGNREIAAVPAQSRPIGPAQALRKPPGRVFETGCRVAQGGHCVSLAMDFVQPPSCSCSERTTPRILSRRAARRAADGQRSSIPPAGRARCELPSGVSAPASPAPQARLRGPAAFASRGPAPYTRGIAPRLVAPRARGRGIPDAPAAHSAGEAYTRGIARPHHTRGAHA